MRALQLIIRHRSVANRIAGVFVRRPEVLGLVLGVVGDFVPPRALLQHYPLLSLLFALADVTRRRFGRGCDAARRRDPRAGRRRGRGAFSPQRSLLSAKEDYMSQDLLRFTVTRLSATVPEGVPITWRGRAFASGPLTIELAARDVGTANQGVLDYTTRRARAEFHVRLSFPQFAETLEDLGVDPAFSNPVEAVLRSEGDILDDHGFALSGTCDLEPHGLLPTETTSAAVLPGH